VNDYSAQDCSSDDDADDLTYRNRIGGSLSKSRKPRKSPAKPKSRSPSKQEAKKAASPKKGGGRAKARPSAATIDTSSDSNDEDVQTRAPGNAPAGLASRASAPSETIPQHSDASTASVDTTNKKNAISRIFALKQKVTTSGQGAGGSCGGGKGGITVERKATPGPQLHQAEVAGAPQRRVDGRPVIACSIPLHRIHRKLDSEYRVSICKKRKMSTSSLTSTGDEDTFRRKKKDEAAEGGAPSAATAPLPATNPNPVLSR
jgi:hypothetical protein